MEWLLRVFTRVFGLTKVRYCGLKKNHEWLCTSFALVSIYQHSRRFVRLNLQTAPVGTTCVQQRPDEPLLDEI